MPASMCRFLASAVLLSLLAAPSVVTAAEEAPAETAAETVAAVPEQQAQTASEADAVAEAALGEAAPAAVESSPASEPADDSARAEEQEEEDGAALAEGVAQAKADLEATIANITAEPQASLRGTAGWGHGIFGEVCCMCARQYGWTTILYAAEDYPQAFGSHAAYWWCNAGCEAKCHFRGGHIFGCYDEQHLLQMDAMYGHRAGYQILHEGHFGNLC